MLAKLGADPRQQHAEPERFGDIVIRAGVQPQDRVRIGIVGREHDDRRLHAAAAHQAAAFAAIHVRQTHIQQHHVEIILLYDLQSLGRRAGRRGLEFLMELQLFGERRA